MPFGEELTLGIVFSKKQNISSDNFTNTNHLQTKPLSVILEKVFNKHIEERAAIFDNQTDSLKEPK